MAKISEVNYKEFPGKAKRMRSVATTINNEICTSYTNLNSMKSNWHGVRYNDLALVCNQIIPDLNNMMKLIVTTIPFQLEQVANNYSIADTRSKVTSEEQTPAKKVLELAKSTDTTMRFLTAEVTNVKEQVGASFDKSLNLLNEFQTIFNSLNWKSEAADAYRKEFTTLKGKIEVAFSNIKKVFVTKIREASEDIQSAETNNTVQ